jgi:hypothetical protein
MHSKTVLIFFILALGFVSSLGFWSLGSVNHSGGHICPISMVSSGDCSSLNNSLALAMHHLSGLQSFVRAVVGFDTILLFLIIFLLVISLSFFIFIEYPAKIPSEKFLFFRKSRRIEELIFRLNKRFLRWLAFHNQQDSYELNWAYGTA